jgi:hypothetical protein
MSKRMTIKQRWKKWVSVSALAALVWTGVAWPGGPVAAAANPFNDVVQGHWAEKHIVKLYLQNIISGKGEGIFDPGGNIRREDAVIMALRFMGLADSVNPSGSFAFPSTFQVDDYAKPYVYEAFNRNILSREEEFDLASKEPNKHWGKEAATREWVAKLIVRAIGKESEAVANAGQATAFSDDARIDPSLRPYVVTAVNQGLVSGVTPTTFDPKSPINRASMATLFSKAQSKVSVVYSGQVSGIVLDIKDTSLTLLHDNGTTKDYPLSSNTMFARYDSDKPASSSDIKRYGRAILIHDANGAIGYVETIDDNEYITTVQGKFSRYVPEDNRIWLSLDNGYQSYVIDSSIAPAISDIDGRNLTLNDIPEGANVTIKADLVRTEPRVFAIQVNQSVINKSGSGTVVSWDEATGTLVVADPATGSSETLTASPQTVFKLVDTPVTSSQLLVGDSISYEVKANVLTSVTIAKRLFTTVDGLFVNVDQAAKIVNILVEGKPHAYFISDSPTIVISGLDNAGLQDLQKNDNVTITLNDKELVTKIVVNGRNVQYHTAATIASYTALTKNLNLSLSDGRSVNYTLDTNIRYDLNGVAISMDEALTRLTVGRKITVAYSGEKAIAIYFVAKYTGTVVENNTTSKILKLRLDNNSTITLNYSYPYIDAYGLSSGSFADIKVGDYVTAVLNDTQDQITTIQVRKNAQLEIVSVDVSASKVRVRKPGTSTVEDWTVSSAVALQNENGATITLSALQPNMVANFTFEGRLNLTKIKLVTSVYGQVKSVNTTSSTIQLGLADGTTVTKSVGLTPTVIRNGATTNTLATVQVGDRIELRTAEDDSSVIEVITPIKKRFWKYDAAAKSITVYRSNLSENNVYKLDGDTLITSGGTKINVTQLKDNDNISIYILRGKVVEVAKN